MEHNIFDGDRSITNMQSFHLLNDSNMNSLLEEGSNRQIF